MPATYLQLNEHVQRHANFIPSKKPNQVDTMKIRDVKGFIRKTEAISGTSYAGLPDSNIHFMALPFYETGKIKKNTAGKYFASPADSPVRRYIPRATL